MADTIAISIPVPHRVSDVTTIIDDVTVGDGADTSSNEVRYDFNAFKPHLFAIRLEGFTTNGQGGTPTAPGSSKHVLVKYAFSNSIIAPADALTILTNAATAIDFTLANSALATAAGQQCKQSDTILVTGRYLYVWLNNDALTTDAEVLVNVKLVRFDA